MEIRPILSTLARHKTAAALIVIEIALTCAIICNALFMIGDRVSQINEPSGIAESELLRIQLTSSGIDDNATARTRTDLAALRAIPGVKDATVVNQVPFVDSSWNSGVRLSNEQPQSTMEATVYMTDEHFISTFGSRLIAGRSFRPDEYLDFETVNSSKEPIGIPAAIVTRKMAEKLYPGIPVAHVIGKVFYSWGDRPIPIVGVLDLSLIHI